MDFITVIIVLLLLILCLPALIIRGGLRRQLAELERKIAAQGNELSSLRAEVNRLGRPSNQESAALSPLPPYIPSNFPLVLPSEPRSTAPAQAGLGEAQEDRPTANSFPPGMPTQEPVVGNAPLMYGPPPAPFPSGSASAQGSGPVPPPAAAGWSPTPRFLFAVIGALLTLGGLTAVLAQLARMGVLTPELQLVLAALLGLTLYAVAPRATGAVRAALRGLGYGILALCMGALHQVGVLPAGGVLGLVLVLSLLVGLHARRQGELLGIAVALTGATVSTWLLADDLAVPPSFAGAGSGVLGWAQTALLCVGAGALGAALSVRHWAARWLLLVIPLGTVGLLVVAQSHTQTGAPAGWAALGLLMAGGVSTLTGRATALRTPDKSLPGLALAVLLTSLLTASPITSLALRDSVAASVSLLALLGGLIVVAAQRVRRVGFAAPDGLREAGVASATAVAAAWLGAALDIGDGAQRLLPLALALALYGRWSGSAPWRWGSVAAASGLLASQLPQVAPADAFLTAAALGSALAIGGRSGSVVAGVAAAVLTTWASRQLPSWWPGPDIWAVTLPVLAGVLTGLAATSRLPERRALPLLMASLVALLTLLAGSPILELTEIGATSAQTRSGLAASLLVSVVLALSLRLPGTALLLARAALPTQLSSLVLKQLAEGLGIGLAVIALVHLFPGSALLVILLLGAALGLPWVKTVLPWPVLSLPLLGVALATALNLPDTSSPQAASSLGSVLLSCAALFLLGSVRGRGLLPWPPAAAALAAQLSRRATAAGETGAALWGGVIAALASAVVIRLAQWLGSAGLLTGDVLPVTLVLFAGGLVMLAQGRARLSSPVWWTGLGLFALAAGKLVLLDLDTLGTGARGAALTVVGLLLLGIAQLAPQARPDGPLEQAESRQTDSQ
ncbi:hypothetical protein E7T06_07810 [Deinococcus sp. Arct2-2]|uniref:hypothetical protein n=1 Tax=Deinococcus sp. Arct2-2 TaxID=2568653 RepID=UPI0010A437C6|nr:hypothetical protein [Deinococcus sp. Arct2-2]THF70363.1 hypothetical protein E7T06_07810 [Deinococcus sp. Arct2-2]